MSATKIEWADRVWNPTSGCTRISAGCDHCYAERMARRLAGRYGYPEGSGFDVTFHENRLPLPATWKRPVRCFVNSMGDLFHEDVKPAWRDQVFEVIRRYQIHTFLILTKRPLVAEAYFKGRPLPSNVWMGVTAENQARAVERLPVLMRVDARVRFVSVEPMLTAVDLRPWLAPYGLLDWVIVGAETGPGARSLDFEWARAIRDQCDAADTAFFFKQAGGGRSTPDDLAIREFPA